MDKIYEFHLNSKSRGYITFHLNNGGNIVIPIQKPHSNKLATSFIAPKREVDILREMIPEDVSLILHEESSNRLLSIDNHIAAFSDKVVAAKTIKNKKAINIIILDAFCLEKGLMNQVEREIRKLRVLYARHNIATTLHHAYPINSANHQAYKAENFALFEGHPFPISIEELNKFDLVLTLDTAAGAFVTNTCFFQPLLDYVLDLKK